MAQRFWCVCVSSGNTTALASPTLYDMSQKCRVISVLRTFLFLLVIWNKCERFCFVQESEVSKQLGSCSQNFSVHPPYSASGKGSVGRFLVFCLVALSNLPKSCMVWQNADHFASYCPVSVCFCFVLCLLCVFYEFAWRKTCWFSQNVAIYVPVVLWTDLLVYVRQELSCGKRSLWASENLLNGDLKRTILVVQMCWREILFRQVWKMWKFGEVRNILAEFCKSSKTERKETVQKVLQKEKVDLNKNKQTKFLIWWIKIPAIQATSPFHFFVLCNSLQRFCLKRAFGSH